MNHLILCLAAVPCALALASGPSTSTTTLPSPDGALVIDYEVLPIVEKFNEALQQTKLTNGGTTVWTYGCIARGFEFSWAPDSSGFLMAITHASRTASLLFVHIENGMDAYPVSIDLARIQDEIAASLPDRPGSSAPKSRVDLDKAEWTSPAVCRVPFSQRFLGKNADSLIELDFADPSQPRWKILSVTPR